MKSFIYILLTSLTFLVVGCQNESEEIRLINQAERLFDAYPDSVITTLDSIPLPEEMSPRLVARWCMLYARAADKIEDEMPYTNQLEIALKYYQKKRCGKRRLRSAFIWGVRTWRIKSTRRQ